MENGRIVLITDPRVANVPIKENNEACVDLLTERNTLNASLYQQIGQLKVQVDWLEKNQNRSIKDKRALIEPGHPRAQHCQAVRVAGPGAIKLLL